MKYRVHDAYGIAATPTHRSLSAAQRAARSYDRQARENGCASQCPHVVYEYDADRRVAYFAADGERIAL